MTVDPYYADGDVTVYHGDCRDIDEWRTADVIVTDPPYGIGYEQTLATAPNWGTITGDDTTDLLAYALEACDGRAAVVFGAHYAPHAIPSPGRWVCWDKRLTVAADRMLGASFELAWCSDETGIAHGRMIRLLHGGVVNADGANQTRWHPTQKPVSLMTAILNDCPPGTVADPFAGSGSTVLAARLAGRPVIAVESEERHCETIAKRCAQGLLPLLDVRRRDRRR